MGTTWNFHELMENDVEKNKHLKNLLSVFHRPLFFKLPPLVRNVRQLVIYSSFAVCQLQ